MLFPYSKTSFMIIKIHNNTFSYDFDGFLMISEAEGSWEARLRWDFDGIPRKKGESETKIDVTLRSGGVGRATGYQNISKHHVGVAGSHRSGPWGPLSPPSRAIQALLPFFLPYLNRLSPMGDHFP